MQVCDTTRSTLAAGAASVADCICAPGYLTNGADCEQCPAGYYQDDKGAGACKPCPPGTYSPPGTPALVDCLPCNPQTVAPRECTAQCTPCGD